MMQGEQHVPGECRGGASVEDPPDDGIAEVPHEQCPASAIAVVERELEGEAAVVAVAEAVLAERSVDKCLSEHANVRVAVETWFEEEKFSSVDYEATQLTAMLRSDASKRAMLRSVAERGTI